MAGYGQGSGPATLYDIVMRLPVIRRYTEPLMAGTGASRPATPARQRTSGPDAGRRRVLDWGVTPPTGRDSGP